ncbi:hypothetical protein BAUCODRAFT_28981 [Baudoinia panamericana UAMH 10762]|uniref:DUF1772 domain-containing protein n=1 Tax=Baudoinia panamericana (strain UAMH 10762) TaxID=717646 RepID=M2M0U0_BAUPA|nr:uncharacterized protein BAUCODRAFT_28981 [Baudoinia panamericana UAMH 10762]EMD00638.1 hypothetical protein BAUCODRAFT_28981 [Baudoinia panamericana UAMH 10762]
MAAVTNHGLFYTEQLTTPLRVAQVVGLTSATFLAGKTFAQSFGTIPAFLKAPAPLLAKQWKTMYDGDVLIAPATSAIGLGVFGYFAYRDPNAWSHHQILYTTASALMAILIPYSTLLLGPINSKLEKKASDLASASLTDAEAESGMSKEESTHGLVDTWGTINFGRAIISGVAALAATWAAVDRLEVVPAVAKVMGGADRMGH